MDQNQEIIVSDVNNNGDNSANTNRPRVVNLKTLAITASAPPPSNNSTIDRDRPNELCPFKKEEKKKKRKIGRKFKAPFRLAVKIDLIQNLVILSLIGAMIVLFEFSQPLMKDMVNKLPKKPTCNNWHKRAGGFFKKLVPRAESAIRTLSWTAIGLIPKFLLGQIFGWLAYYLNSYFAATAFGTIKGLSAILDLLAGQFFQFNIVSLVFFVIDVLSMVMAFVFGCQVYRLKKKAQRPVITV